VTQGSDEDPTCSPTATSEQEPGEAVVVLPIEDSIDLHTFDPRDVPSVVESYIEAAWEKGFEEVRVIHGRGKGIQRARVREVLAADPRVRAFGDAPGTRGGWGATLVWLKPRP
jgi:DNA-nicking Smr family endonuclease